jgi:hypothetical protein
MWEGGDHLVSPLYCVYNNTDLSYYIIIICRFILLLVIIIHLYHSTGCGTPILVGGGGRRPNRQLVYGTDVLV